MKHTCLFCYNKVYSNSPERIFKNQSYYGAFWQSRDISSRLLSGSGVVCTRCHQCLSAREEGKPWVKPSFMLVFIVIVDPIYYEKFEAEVRAEKLGSLFRSKSSSFIAALRK